MENIKAYLISVLAITALICNPYGYNLFELPKVHFLAIFSALLLIISSAAVIFRNKIEFRYNKYVFIILFLWLLSLVVSTIFSISPQLSFWGSYERLQGLYSHITYIVLFIAFLQTLITEKNQRIFMNTTIAIGGLVSIHSILQQFGIATFGEESMNITVQRSFSTMGNPNFLAQFLIFPLWLSGYFLIKNKGKSKILYALIFILIIVGIILTKSRASILGIIIATTILLVFHLKIKRYLKYLLVLGLFASFTAFVIFIASNMQSLMARFYIWKGSIGIIKDHWLIGSGLETFKTVFQKVQLKELLSVEEIYSIADRAHNVILDIFITQGFFGILAYGSIIGGLLYIIFKSAKKQNLMILCFSGALGSSFIASMFSFYVATDYVMIAATIAIILNLSTSFIDVKIKNNPFSLFIVGMVFAFSGIVIFWGGRAIYADMIYLRGMEKISSYYFEEGLEDITKATNLNIQQSGAALSLVRILEVIGESSEDQSILILDNAEIILDNYSSIIGENFEYYFEKGEIATISKKYDLAEKFYRQASLMAPNQPIILRQWGVMSYKKGDYQSTINKLEQFLEIIPPYWKWKNDLKFKSFDDKEKYRLFFKEKEDFWDIFPYLSEGYKKIGDNKKADYYNDFIENKKRDE